MDDIKSMGGLNKAPISNNEGGVIVRLWRKILYETNLINNIHNLILVYQMKNNKNDQMKVRKRKTKSSLIKNIWAPEMTWKTFIYLLENFLNVRKIDISIKLTHDNGEESIHSVTINNVKENNVNKGDGNHD